MWPHASEVTAVGFEAAQLALVDFESTPLDHSVSSGTAVWPHESEVTAVGFEPTQLALVELESTPLDHSGKLS